MNREELNMEDTQKFLKYEYKFEHKDLNNNDLDIEISDDAIHKVTFNGLTKEEVMKFETDPTWVKIRWSFFILFWVVWIGMLAGAVLIVVFSDPCPPIPKESWWEKDVVYQLQVENFKDSNNDGTGDLQGLIEKLDYFDELGVKTLLLGEMLIDSSSPLRVNPQFGDETTMKELRKRLDHRDMHLIVDLNRQLLDKNTDDVLTLWLTKYVDGVRIIKSNLLDIKENATKWINQVNSISKSTFKPKFIAFYPFEAAEYTFNPSTVIDRTLINVNKEEDFVQKIEKLNGDSFALGDFELNNQRISGLVQDKDKSLLKIYQSLVFLLKGTPYLLYGDELEFKGEDKHMRWDNSMNCGFSENKTIVVSNADCGVNVKRQKATGAGNTLTRLYKTMITLRNEPAFQWGEIKFSNVEPNLIAFIRKAERFESFIVVSNTDRNQTKNVDLQKLFNIKAVTGKVAHFFSIDQFNQEFQVDKEITMDNILLKFGELLVVKFD